MKTFNIHEAKTNLSRLVEAAANGEEIVIAKAGKPMAKLVAITREKGPRTLGALAGSVKESADCWAGDPDIEALFYGSDSESEERVRVAEPPPRES
jgi:prevent-host-death family protein